MKHLITFLLMLCMFITGEVFAGGFQINKHGARPMAMGGAYTALARDVSALYFNPAGLIYSPGLQMSLGTTIIAPSASFRGPSPSISESKTVNKLFTPSHFYISKKMTDDWALGFAFNNPFGLGTEWEPEWVGRFITVKTDLKVYSFTPAASFRLCDKLSFGLGFQFNYATVEIVRKLNLYPFNAEATVNLEGDYSFGFGFNAGLMYSPTDNFTIAASYRSPVKHKFRGDANTTAPAQFTGRVPTGTISAELTTPGQIVGGIAVTPSKALTISADFQYVFWSSYDTLKVVFDNPAFPSSAAPRMYQDTWIGRIGAEYRVSDQLALRAGFSYDKNPVKDEYLDPLLPSSDRFGFSGGIGYKLTENFNLDLSYLYFRFNQRTVTNSLISYSGNPGFAPVNGTYNASANLFAITFSYRFN